MTLPPQIQSHSQKSHNRHCLSTCHLHPTVPITGFCASCLRERLAGIEPSTHELTTTQEPHSGSEHRRSKSLSRSKQPESESSGRKSCDVRARNSLSDLLTIGDMSKRGVGNSEEGLGNKVGFEEKEEGESSIGIRVSEDEDLVRNREDEIDEESVELKTMKEFIDLEFQRKKSTARDFKDIAGVFREAASVFSKKLRKWRWKKKPQKLNDENGGLLLDINRGRRLRETQSEVGEYGLGRRSCDTDPRLSLDAHQMSLDENRYSFDEPRASWDGYLIGKAYPRMTPLVSVVEDGRVSGDGSESVPSESGNAPKSPGGSAQTKVYYSESLTSQRRRKSFDRSSSIHRKSLGAEIDDLKLYNNFKVSPACTELFYGAQLHISESKPVKPMKDEKLEIIESNSKDVAPVVPDWVNRKVFRKTQRWQKVWSIWGLMQRRTEPKCEHEERFNEDNVGVEQLADSWKLKTVVNGESNGSVSQKLIRSYSVSCRNNLSKFTGLISSNAIASGVEAKGNGIRRKEELLLQRNRSARYSPDNGMLRFYLTPLRSYGRSKSGNSRLKNSYSTSHNVF